MQCKMFEDFCKQEHAFHVLKGEHDKLKSTVEMQNMRIAQLEDTLRACKQDVSNVVSKEDLLATCMRDVDSLTERVRVVEKSKEEAPKLWADRLLSPTPNAATMRIVMQEKNPENVDMDEWREREKRSKNVVIRGIPETDQETTPSLATELKDFFHTYFGMSGIKVYGAHRVGKSGASRSTHRAIVCSMVDDSKRNIILENSRFYLKDTTFSVYADRTIKQQEASRKAYEERMAKKKPPITKEDNA